TSDLRRLNGILIKRLDRANTNVSVARSENKKLTWHARKSGVYTIECRSLARKLCDFGCAEDSVADSIHACAEAFGVTVIGDISRRTVGRTKKEGGMFGLMQLGREIDQSDGLPSFPLRIMIHANFTSVWRKQ
ncbi:hypothetical protein DXG01_009230, partial [Tephrocybe rancida]